MKNDEPLLRFAIRLVLAVALFSTCARAQDRWSIDFGVERSDVAIDGADDVWGVERLHVSFQEPDEGGAFFSVERHTRFEAVDPVFRVGGYRRLGDWTVFGQVGLTPNADFYFRQSVEGELSRRTFGSLVAHFKYRFLNFPAAHVHVMAPAATYYFSSGELHGRLHLVRNETLEVDSRSFLMRGHWQALARLRVGGGLAIGERIFDITSLPGEPAEGWVVYGETLVTLHEHGALGVMLGLAHEEPFFDRTNFGVFYRRWF